jgi:hypothetical protein
MSSLDKCYMRELSSCVGSISGEHLVSDSIIRLLKSDGDFSVSGLPWLSKDEAKILAPKNLTANCLCQKHNSALSPLDDAALSFFEAVKSGLEHEAQPTHFLVSGHDVERWLLKTVKAMAASRNLSQGRKRLSGAFASDIQVLDMLDDPKLWPDNTGLYSVMNEGSTTENNLRFQLQPLTNPQDEISGIWVNILGLPFVLVLERLDNAQNLQLRQAKFRPGEIAISHPSGVNRIALSWEDGKPHNETLSLEFVRTVTRA